jgi:hypothetical protein
MTPARDTLPLSLALVLATAAAIGSSPTGRRVIATIDTDTLIGIANEIGVAMAGDMAAADPTESSQLAATPSPAIAPLLPLLRRSAHRTAF